RRPPTGVVEGGRVEGRLLEVVTGERRERHASRLALAARLRDIHEDPEDPRTERGAALVAVEALEDAEPRILDDLARDRIGRNEHPGDALHRRGQLLDQLDERGLIVGAE